MITNKIDLKSYFETTDQPTQSEFAELIDHALPISDKFDVSQSVSKTSTPLVGSTFISETSTFSGWSTLQGVVPAFRFVKFKARAFGGDTITSLVVRIRENNNLGTILATKTVDFDTDADDYQTVEFDADIDNANPLHFEVLANAKMGCFGSQYAYGSSPVPAKYRAGNSQTGDITSQVSGTTDTIQHVIFISADQDVVLSSAGLTHFQEQLQLSDAPRIVLPDRIDTVYGEATQLFYNGMIEAINLANYEIRIEGKSSLHTGGVAGKQYPRYFEFTPATTGTSTLSVSVRNDDRVELATASTTINITNPTGASSPASNVRVLCIGDSLTDADTWVDEFARRLIGSGGSPAGKSLSNIQFIGSNTDGTYSHEGRAGRDWDWFANHADSPLTTGTDTLDITNYIGTTLGEDGVEQVYILLGWNSMSGSDGLPKKDAADWDTDISDLTDILDAFVADYPSVQITLVGLNLPSQNGGLGDDYGDANSNLSQQWLMNQNVFGLKLALKAITENPTYSGFVDFLDLAPRFDAVNNMPSTTKAVNTRNTDTEVIGANGVHPSASGYYQMADSAYGHFAAKHL